MLTLTLTVTHMLTLTRTRRYTYRAGGTGPHIHAHTLRLGPVAAHPGHMAPTGPFQRAWAGAVPVAGPIRSERCRAKSSRAGELHRSTEHRHQGRKMTSKGRLCTGVGFRHLRDEAIRSGRTGCDLGSPRAPSRAKIAGAYPFLRLSHVICRRCRSLERSLIDPC